VISWNFGLLLTGGMTTADECGAKPIDSRSASPRREQRS
jgi:hypothetical protein